MLINSVLHMLTSKRFVTNFGMLAGISRLALGVALGLVPSCALDDNTSTADQTGDQTTVDSSADDDGSSDSVCSGGKFRCFAHVRTNRAGQRIASHAATPTGFGPPDLQAAYGIDPTVVVPTKPVVGIVDAYGYPALESDLAAYRSFYGLTPCTQANGCLKIVNQTGQAAPLPAAPPANDDWTVETALDIDMVSAACPKCDILVVQADDSSGDGLYIAENAAASLGATVISNSWGGPEQAGTTAAQTATSEAYFDHAGIAIFVSAGDDGYNDAGQGPDYPGTSAHVISVGGTHLVKDTSTRGWTETAWTKGGSACSLSIAKPAYQTASPCTFKATTDVAAVGDPATGLAVYNAKNGGWITVGGTSASSPFVASIFAATGNGGQISGSFIAQKAALFNDVLSGNNGTCPAGETLLCNAAAGWDGPTGYGTPNAKALMPATTTTGTGTGPGTGTGTTAGSGQTTTGSDPTDTQEVQGGCSTTGGSTGAGLLFGFALVALRRRRK
jgi:uncharacterized protein (TIGR03382 family)